MSLHRLSHVVIGVPNVDETEAYYTDFGLAHGGDGAFSTRDGGRQLRLVPRPQRQLVELGIAADDTDDLARIAASLAKLGVTSDLDGDALTAQEPVAGFTVRIRVLPRLQQEPSPPTPYNGPGRLERTGRAPGIVREERVRPRRLGHAVAGTTDLAATTRFMVEGLGFKVSDQIGDKGAFLRCSTDHHNFLALQAPVNYLHHTSWQVDDVDDVGRGAFAMLEKDPDRHVWGLGRHHAGSNFFWYLKDPAGNFSEYFSDMDCIPEDEIWEPEVLEGAKGLFNWGPPPPPSFLNPEDLAGLMTGAHSKA
ncbi:glyoxalase/bleomycin resistance protein/dioxygenase superfamily protein [Nocardioides albertanoniae]|uniref:Glyoxalase/bleomycin resistance protein/dioxygenase superfamily protein n=1 Tax=Nocardioides albertanoniae TaxID=1175486 RepID=A0A543A5S4_9ACTN|nr:VOC family protein [Nocardioides albertanoniae]TQL67919.1 glyoxalase/bleomycin resistance protein/dioxygenase superfamily protein [Nocardioides albertanoniae]